MAGPFIMPASQCCPAISHGLSFQGAYVWSKNIDNGSGKSHGGENYNLNPNPYVFLPNYNRAVPIGRPAAPEPQFSGTCPRSRFGMVASFAPLGLGTGWNLHGQNGMPFTPEISVDALLDAATSVPMKDGLQCHGLLAGRLTPVIRHFINLQCFSYPANACWVTSGVIRCVPGAARLRFSLGQEHNCTRR